MYDYNKKNTYSKINNNVEIRLIVNKYIFSKISDVAHEQLLSLTNLEPINSPIISLPDIQPGFGVPIGTCFASPVKGGIISCEAIGFDINCGVRLISLNLFKKDLDKEKLLLLKNAFNKLPLGLSKDGIKISVDSLEKILENGIDWAIANNYENKNFKTRIDNDGCYKNVDTKFVSRLAKQRGVEQIGTLGEGNHFLDLVLVSEVYDSKTCKLFNLKKDQYCILLHTGSRGLGHQVGRDFYDLFENKYPISNAPIDSEAGQAYFSAMKCAANYAYVNRAVFTRLVLNSIKETLDINEEELGYNLVYDVCHNIANIEKHNNEKLLVHRKGATRVYTSSQLPKNHIYFKTGTPILLPGSMTHSSYVLKGNPKGLANTYSTVAHGSGRLLSRDDAKNNIIYELLCEKLKKKGILLGGRSENVAREEQPLAYKDSKKVVECMVESDLVKTVCKLDPKIVITG